MWWDQLKKFEDINERRITSNKIKWYFQKEYFSKKFYDKKMQELFELRLGSMTMTEYENNFLGLLKYVTFIKDEKVRIQRFLVELHHFIRKWFSMMSLEIWQSPSGRISTYIRKAREDNPCINLGRIIRRRNMIIGGRGSNLLSIETILIKIRKMSLLKMNLRKKTPWKNRKTTNLMLGVQRK